MSEIPSIVIATFDADKCHAATTRGAQCSFAPIEKSERSLCKRHQTALDKKEAGFRLVRSGNGESAAVEKATATEKKEKKATSKVVAPKAAVQELVQCGAMTKSNSQCTKHAYGNVNGEPRCSMHGGPKKDGTAASPKTSGTKTSSSSNSCSHTTKKNTQCIKPAFGNDANGKLACSMHGGPKKGGGASAVASKTSAPPVPNGTPSTLLITKIARFFAGHADCDDCTEDQRCPLAQSCYWALGHFELYVEGTPTAKEVMGSFVEATKRTSDGEIGSFHDEEGCTVFFFLEKQFKRAAIESMLRKLHSYTGIAGDSSGAICTLWTQVCNDLEMEETVFDAPVAVAVARAPTNSVKSDKLTNGARQNAATLIRRAQAKAVEEEVQQEKEEELDMSNLAVAPPTTAPPEDDEDTVEDDEQEDDEE